jgi:hypothetical protein
MSLVDFALIGERLYNQDRLWFSVGCEPSAVSLLAKPNMVCCLTSPWGVGNRSDLQAQAHVGKVLRVLNHLGLLTSPIKARRGLQVGCSSYILATTAKLYGDVEGKKP